ncbi:hypothetical protein Q5H93_10220 [Hymenobacter sp. ASUV-10]|uniref:Uncharacterized protein n=1 Tax=Hymenobacter aranciens TaxID=3063996 RepID=A0ABT9BA10_9BACT|nr:hypothetical protein [Hymenobacter sp. ASUV-10]MDO7875106.1 hypothetical protein [Hymenobacter sp. ASUV-10]
MPSVSRLACFLFSVIGLLSNNYCYAQQLDSSRSRYAAFDELMQKLPPKRHGNTLLTPPVIFRDSTYTQPRALEYELRLSEQPLKLQHQTVRLHNPKSGGDRPACYSVVYQNCLVALFTTGNFGCFRITNFERDTLLEAQLNTFVFERHWILNQQLIGWREGRAFYFDTIQRTWQSYKQPLPFEGRLKVFEDERFVCTMDCHGEFGGHIYFFDKRTRRTHYTNATCATTVQKIDGQYHLLASLAHMQGSTHSAVISAPEKLPVITKKLDPARDWQYHFADSKPNEAVKSVFNYYGLTMAGSFQWHEQILYVVNLHPITFLASISGKSITIVDPLFNRYLSPDNTIATAFAPNSALVSYSHYESRKTTEGRCLLFQDRRVTEIVWGN